MVLSSALRRLLLPLQTRCTADCCRAGAFGFEAEGIASWLRSEPAGARGRLADDLTTSIASLATDASVTLDVRGLESQWPTAELRAFLTSLQSAVAERSE